MAKKHIPKKENLKIGSLVFVKTCSRNNMSGAHMPSFVGATTSPSITFPNLQPTWVPRPPTPRQDILPYYARPDKTTFPQSHPSPYEKDFANPSDTSDARWILGGAFIEYSTDSAGVTAKKNKVPSKGAGTTLSATILDTLSHNINYSNGKSSAVVSSNTTTPVYKIFQNGVLTISNTSNSNKIGLSYFAEGYAKIEDYIHANPIYVKQTEELIEKENTTNKSEPVLWGKPFKGIIVDTFIPKFKTENGEEVCLLGDRNEIPTMYKVLFGEKDCLWFVDSCVYTLTEKE